MNESIICIALVGAALAWFATRAAELRHLRLVQILLTPAIAVAIYLQFPSGPANRNNFAGELLGLLTYLLPVAIVAVLFAPNIAYAVGYGLQNVIDPQDWQPSHQEIDLQEVRRLVRQEDYRSALRELDQRLKRALPNYEALLLQAQLRFHFGNRKAARQTLLRMLALTTHAEQQANIMRLYHDLAKTND